METLKMSVYIVNRSGMQPDGVITTQVLYHQPRVVQYMEASEEEWINSENY